MRRRDFFGHPPPHPDDRHRGYGYPPGPRRPPPPPPHFRGGGGFYGGPPPPGRYPPMDPFFHGRGPPPPPMPMSVRERERGPRRGPPGISLLVRNIGNDVTTDDIRSAFSRIGRIRDVYIPKDYHTHHPKGFAFVEMANPEIAAEARDEMNRFVMKGRELEVVFAQERRKTPHEMRGRGGVNDGNSGGRDIGRRGRGGFERSSSFERHQERERFRR